MLRGFYVAFVYVEDVLIAGTDEHEHHEHLGLVFQRFREYDNLPISLSVSMMFDLLNSLVITLTVKIFNRR